MADREDILRRVRGLLDKADSTKFEAEADSYRQKADELMLRYAIDSFDVASARNDATKRETPVLRKFDICKADNPIRISLIDLVASVARHARCRVVIHGGNLPTSYSNRASEYIPTVSTTVVGFPADTEYAEMLFTSLWLQMSSEIEPKPNPEMTFEENVVMLLEAGQSRKHIAEMMFGEFTHSMGQRMSKVYKEWCIANGKPYSGKGTRPLPITYMRNFAAGFVSRVDIRLYEIRKRSEKAVGGGEGTAIVLRDRDAEIRDAYRVAFPKLGTLRQKVQGKFDAGARGRGDDAGKRADLGQKRVGDKRKELGS